MTVDEFGEIVVRNRQFQVLPSPKTPGSSRKRLSVRNMGLEAPKTTGSLHSRRSLAALPANLALDGPFPPPPPPMSSTLSPPKSRKSHATSSRSTDMMRSPRRTSTKTLQTSSLHSRSEHRRRPIREQRPVSFCDSPVKQGLPPMSPVPTSQGCRTPKSRSTTTMALKPKSLARLSMLYDETESRWDIGDSSPAAGMTRSCRSARNLMSQVGDDDNSEFGFKAHKDDESAGSLNRSAHSAPPLRPTRATSITVKKEKTKTKKTSTDKDVTTTTPTKLKKKKKVTTGSTSSKSTTSTKKSTTSSGKEDKKEKKTKTRRVLSSGNVSATATDKTKKSPTAVADPFDFPMAFNSWNMDNVVVDNDNDDVWNATTDDANNEIDDPWHTKVLKVGFTGTMKLKDDDDDVVVDEAHDSSDYEWDSESPRQTPKKTSKKKVSPTSVVKKSAMKSSTTKSKPTPPQKQLSSSLHTTASTVSMTSYQSIDTNSLKSNTNFFESSFTMNNLNGSATSFFEEENYVNTTTNNYFAPATTADLQSSASSLDAVAVFENSNDVPNWMKRRIEAKLRLQQQQKHLSVS